MKVLICESNLFWSARLAKSAKAFGHDAEVWRDGTSLDPGADREVRAPDVAIVNLAEPSLQTLVPQLRERGVYVIGHAGHKEKDLHELGKEVGCDRLATNGELTYKLDKLLEETAKRS